MTCLTISFTIQPTTPIGTAARDLCGMADQLGCTCRALFNGVMLEAGPGSDAEMLASDWNQMFHVKHLGGSPFVVRGRPRAQTIVEQNDWAGDDDRSIGMTAGDVE